MGLWDQRYGKHRNARTPTEPAATGGGESSSGGGGSSGGGSTSSSQNQGGGSSSGGGQQSTPWTPPTTGSGTSDKYNEFISGNPTLDRMLDQLNTEWQHAAWLDRMGHKEASRAWGNVNDLYGRVQAAGGSWAPPEGGLTDEDEEALRAWYSAAGSEEAAMSDIQERQAARTKARDIMDQASEHVRLQTVFPQAMAIVSRELANPEAISEEMQRLIEGGIRKESRDATRSFERGLRDDLGARGLPGAPGMSGSGLRRLAGFSRGMASDTASRIADARVRRLLANKDHQTNMVRLAEELSLNDPELMLLREKANLEVGLPFSGAGMGFAPMSQLQSALEARREAGKTDWGSIAAGLGGAALGAFTGGFGGGSANALVSSIFGNDDDKKTG